MTDRVDERDTMFARMARQPGTGAYREYYARHPELVAGDDRLRALPELLQPGGRHFDAGVCADAARYFDDIRRIAASPDEIAGWRDRLVTAVDKTALVKDLVLALGAVAVGCTTVDEAFVYSHKGRFDEDYGRPIEPVGGHAVVFLVEMDFDAMQRAPRAEVIRESARQYCRGARVAKVVEAVLVASGHRAIAHYDARYEVILPPLAVAAGLGELGRNNILVADRYGSRVRIGAVTTSLALRSDRTVSLGVERFCDSCRKCAVNCPSRALSTGPRVDVRGTRRWPTDVTRCYGYWRAVGTDCGICMAVCPFSHPSTPFHNLVRFGLRVAPWLAPLALLLDDWVYGRSWPDRSPQPPIRS